MDIVKGDRGMLRIAIVEDDIQSARHLHDLIERFGGENNIQIQITHFSDGAKLTGAYCQVWDLLFLDVDMPVMGGFEAAKYIRQADPDVCIVFITNLAQYAIRGYEVDALDYILKPVNYYALSMRMKRILRLLRTRETDALMLKKDGDTVRIPLSHIYYIESFNHELHYHTAEETLAGSGSTLSGLEKTLTPCGFVRCHNCYLVNMRYVDGVHSNVLRVMGQELPISRNRRRAVMDALLAYARGGHL